MSLIKCNLNSKRLKIYLIGVPVFRLSCASGIYRSLVSFLLKKRMKKKLTTIKQHEKIRVAFLVSEQAKWTYQSVYEIFDKDPRFEPVVLVTKLYLEHMGMETHYKTMADCFDFFKSLGLRVESAYDEKNKKYIPLNELNVDIVFYQQPWDLDAVQRPVNVSKYAITAYSAYGFDLLQYEAAYIEDFHRFLDMYFTPSDANLTFIKSIAKNVTNCVIVGSPKLDQYFVCKRKAHTKPTVIYAPHHSFEQSGLRLATFQHNGELILETAKQTKDKINWVFKPHPRFKHAILANNIMSQSQIDDYYSQWESIGNIVETGDYIGLFNNSDALITDCCAFLAEYLPSKQPVLHLISKYANFNNQAKLFIDSYYQIRTNQDFIDIFKQVVVEENDYKKAERLSKIKTIFDDKHTAAKKIFTKISDLIIGEIN